MEHETPDDVVEIGVVDFLRRSADLLAEFGDRLAQIEKRLTVAEDIPGKIASELATSIRQLSERVDSHDELFPIVQQMGADLHAITEKVRIRMAQRRPRPPDPNVN
jgi:hypothetical protein